MSCFDCKCAVVPGSQPVARDPQGPGLLAIVTDAPSDAEVNGRSPFSGQGGDVLKGTLEAVGRYHLSELARATFDIDAEVAFFHALTRPLPGNKSPRIADIRACRPRLLEELDAACPRAILTAGAGACAALAGTGKATPITSWRGLMRWVELPNSGLIPWIATIAPTSVASRSDLYRDFSADIFKVWHQLEPMPEPVVVLLEELP